MTNTDKERAAYIDFMCNPDNAYNCDHCPENHGFSSWGGNQPCGQQNCWVICHCKKGEDNND